MSEIDALKDTFLLYLQEPEYLQEASNQEVSFVEENFRYFLVEAGEWQLANGAWLAVGTISTNQTVTHGWEDINFNRDFAETPVILS